MSSKITEHTQSQKYALSSINWLTRNLIDPGIQNCNGTFVLGGKGRLPYNAQEVKLYFPP